jgi:hypothetical protein
MLMESGVSYNKEKLHQQGYFHQVLPANPEIDPSLWPLLKLSREMIERTQKTERTLLRSLEADPLLAARVDRLMTIPAIGHATALTWVLEVGEVERFPSVKQVISYCGLCSGEKTSAGNSRRMPISKQRNRHLQTVLLEAADLAPRLNPELAVLYEREAAQSNRNQAAIAVARKLAAYLLAIDSVASQVLRHSPTSSARACPPFGSGPSRTGLDRQTKAHWRSPGSRACCFSACAGSSTTQDRPTNTSVYASVDTSRCRLQDSRPGWIWLGFNRSNYLLYV